MRQRWRRPCASLAVAAIAAIGAAYDDCDTELDGLARVVSADGADRVGSEDLFLLQVRAQRAQPAAQPVAANDRNDLDPREVLRDFGSMAKRMRQGVAKFSYAVPSRLVGAVQALGGKQAHVVAKKKDDVKDDDETENACIWSSPAAASTAEGEGPVRSYDGDLSAEACLRWCLGESTCLAAVFESSTGKCHGVPWRSGEGLQLVVADPSAVVARKSCAQDCVFSRPRSGKSPGSVLQNHTVRNLQECQQLCSKEEDCLSMVFRATKRSCYLLPRAFDEKAEFAIDDAMMSNKLCRTHCSFGEPSLLNSQQSSTITHLAHVSTMNDCQKACHSVNATCHSVLFHERQSTCALLPSNNGAQHFVGLQGSVIAHMDCGAGHDDLDDSHDDSSAETDVPAVGHEDDDDEDDSDTDVSADDLLQSADDYLSSLDSESAAIETAVAAQESDHGKEEDSHKLSGKDEAPAPAPEQSDRHDKKLSPPKTLLDGQAFSGKGNENQTALHVSVQSGFSVAFSASWYSLGFWARVVDLTDGRVGDGSGDILRVANVEDTNALFFSVRAGGHESHVQVKDAISVGVTSRFLFSVSSAGVLRVFRDGKLLGHAKGRPMQELAHGELFLARPTVRQKRAQLHTFEGWLSDVCSWSREASWEEAKACKADGDDKDGRD